MPNMPGCDSYNPDNVFKRFKVVEFPVSFVGLSTMQPLDVEIDLSKSAYLKTMYEGNLMVIFFFFYLFSLRKLYKLSQEH